MTEYIKREALLEKCHWVIRSDGTRVYVCHTEDIEAIPAADVAPARRGHWLPPVVGSLGALCSECETQSDNAYNFCPNCGAKMDLEEQT